MAALTITSTRIQVSSGYSTSSSGNASKKEGLMPNGDSFVFSGQELDQSSKWSQGLRVAAKMAIFAAPAALGAATGDGTLAAGGMIGSMAAGMFLSSSSNDDNIVLLHGFAAICGTALSAAAGGFGGITGAAAVIGGFAAVGGLAAGLAPSGDPNLPYAR